MKVAYLHGLESNGIGPKNDFLKKTFSKVYDPIIDYRDTENVWDTIYNDILKFRPDYIIGSSMGGWFAYNIGKKLGVPTLLFNPALHTRSINPNVDTSGSKYPKHTLVLGSFDKVIDPVKTERLVKDSLTKININREPIGHRTPVNIFIEYVLKIKKGEI